MKFKKLTDKQFNTLVKISVIFALAYFISGVAMAEPIKVAVLDTGYDFKSTWSKSITKPKLCAEGHKDFTECTILDYVLSQGVKVIDAAGNEHSDLTVKPFYPAMCDSRIYKIAAKTANNKRLPASNYTNKPIPNLFWELEHNVVSLLPNNFTGAMSGTSQATAIFTQKLVRSLYMYRIERAIKLNRTA